MVEYKKLLSKNLKFMRTFACLAAVFIALTGTFVSMTTGINEDISDLIPGSQIGIFIGLQIAMLIYIRKYSKALKTEDGLKTLYIEEHDERTKLIYDKTGVSGFRLSLAVITIATIIAGFFNQIIFLTLLAVLFFMLMVSIFLNLYYKNKF
ncbi:hypothetical protein LL033_12780 [Clostridium estertheticum]|uniref:hypothetical protein n=1 Tax=Clostridium estertheticum TaxID=238834 RepID=UPI001C0B8EE1|nr:hypothetical protein [Clostridium estertheticum]MBU3213669.1 hypothetical protein [Clostridium estertheticum]WAG53560.1 hypothetical protein LL033_12780 [Clostridium estertheticum]